MRWNLVLVGVLSVAAALPASAQDWGVTRRRFTFLDNEVTVEVLADVPGTLQIVRGEPGSLDVAGRVNGGITSFALGGRDGSTLRLSVVGGQQAEFMVVVPEDAHLRVRLPNRKSGDLGSTRPGGTFTWAGKDEVEQAAIANAITNFRGIGGAAYSATNAPLQLSIPKLTSVRNISVRIGSSVFDVSGSQIVSAVSNGSDVVVTTGDQADAIVVNVPAGTRNFTLSLGGRTALVIRDVQVTAYCEPVTEQILDRTRHWFNFAPQAGLLRCR
ncbi:MAG TPA: hypothetical protein VM100_02785 [Longimicrobiales bacterium]|nr:hypothetical protein [Longimicrobiales bacterium]